MKGCPIPPPRPGVDDIAPLASMESDSDLNILTETQEEHCLLTPRRKPTQKQDVRKALSLPYFPTVESAPESLPGNGNFRSESEPNIASPVSRKDLKTHTPRLLQHTTLPLVVVTECDQMTTEGSAAAADGEPLASLSEIHSIEVALHTAHLSQAMELLVIPSRYWEECEDIFSEQKDNRRRPFKRSTSSSQDSDLLPMQALSSGQKESNC